MLLQTYAKDKVILFSLLVALIWCVLDIISQTTNSHNKGFELAEQPAQALHYFPTTIEYHNSLVARFKQFAPQQANNESKQNAEQGLSAEEQRKQQGVMKEAYLQNKKIALKAIVIDSQTEQKTALLLVNDIKTGVQKIERFNHGTTVYGFNLLINNQTQVSLERVFEDATQEITLTMYVMPIKK